MLSDDVVLFWVPLGYAFGCAFLVCFWMMLFCSVVDFASLCMRQLVFNCYKIVIYSRLMCEFEVLFMMQLVFNFYEIFYILKIEVLYSQL
jgi:hypothetical protein